jgi:hypothetical protein
MRARWLMTFFLLGLIFLSISSWTKLLGRDFIQYWTAGRALSAGISPYDQDFQTAVQQANGWEVTREPIPFQPYFYPPWLAILLWPLSWLPYHVALSIWFAISLAAIGFASILLWQLTRSNARPLELALVLLLTFTFLPVLHLLGIGQIGSILLALAALLIWSSPTRHDRLAGISLGLMSIKPQLGLIIALVVGAGWLWQRRWRALSWTAFTWGLCLALSFVVFPGWPAAMMAAPQRFTDLTGWAFPLNGYQDDPTLYAVLQTRFNQSPWLAIISLVLLIMVAASWVYRRANGYRLTPPVLACLACLTPFVLSPYTRAYDMILIVCPLIYLLFAPQVTWSPLVRSVVVLIVYAWPIALLVLGAQGVWNVPAIFGLALALLLSDMSRGHRVRLNEPVA